MGSVTVYFIDQSLDVKFGLPTLNEALWYC